MSQPRTILILDDDTLVREALALGLRDHGYAVRAVSDLLSALNVIRQIRPAAVVSDLQLPDLPDTTAIAVMRAHFPALPIVAMSGAHELEPRALANGANAFLPKPTRVARICDCLDRLLQTGGLRRTAS